MLVAVRVCVLCCGVVWVLCRCASRRSVCFVCVCVCGCVCACVCVYLLQMGLSWMWMVLSSCTLPLRPTMLELGTLKLVLLWRREQQERPCGEEEEDREEERDACFTMDTSRQLLSNVCSSTNSWF